MELIIIGLVTAANFLILKIKAEQHRWADLIFDVAVLSILSFLFSGTLGGLTIAMVSSLTVSVYLYFFPPNLKKIFSWYIYGQNMTIDINIIRVLKKKGWQMKVSIHAGQRFLERVMTKAIYTCFDVDFAIKYLEKILKDVGPRPTKVLKCP